MTALAKVGSPTSTSLTSRGRSITTDLPTPSRSATCSPCRSPHRHVMSSCRGANSETNHVDAAPPSAVIGHGFRFVLLVEVDDAAQRERERALLPRQRQRLGLPWRELERCSLADHHSLAVLLLDGLINRQHAYVGENDLADVRFHADLLLHQLVPARQDDVDMIVRQDESAGTGLGRDFDRDRAHTLRQNGGHVARAAGLDQLGLADRLAGRERGARDRAGELIDGVGTIALADEIGACGGGRPGLPTQVTGRDFVAEPDVGSGDQDVGGFELSDGGGGRRRRLGAASKQCRDRAGDEGDDEHNDTRGFHTLTSYDTRRPKRDRNSLTTPPTDTWSYTGDFIS